MGLKELCYPDIRIKNVLEITSDFIEKNHIEGLILDIDNTLMDYDGNILEGISDWINSLKKINVKICLLTNTKTKKKAEKISKLLNDLPFVYFAKKPLKSGFKKAKKILKQEKNIAVVGDQIMTDVLGANRMEMLSILVSPLGKNEILPTKINRKIEKILFGKSNQDM